MFPIRVLSFCLVGWSVLITFLTSLMPPPPPPCPVPLLLSFRHFTCFSVVGSFRLMHFHRFRTELCFVVGRNSLGMISSIFMEAFHFQIPRFFLYLYLKIDHNSVSFTKQYGAGQPYCTNLYSMNHADLSGWERSLCCP